VAIIILALYIEMLIFTASLGKLSSIVRALVAPCCLAGIFTFIYIPAIGGTTDFGRRL
jgi:antibiotic biosynthesis monooxygenase (ABM) superfamily enzyme